jgi:cell division protein FtsN
MKRWVFALMGLVATVASAQTNVYRCGPDGRAYSQNPCPQGRVVDVSDPRSADQRAEAQAVARADALRAERMAQERRAESQRPVARAGHINARPTPVEPLKPPGQSARKKKRHVRSKPAADFRAVAPKPSPSPKKTARKKKPASAG